MNDTYEMIKLEDNINYAIINKTIHNSFEYLLLANINRNEDICIRKTTIDDTDTILGLDDEKEFDFALNLLTKKN